MRVPIHYFSLSLSLCLSLSLYRRVSSLVMPHARCGLGSAALGLVGAASGSSMDNSRNGQKSVLVTPAGRTIACAGLSKPAAEMQRCAQQE